jgi:hypothetical protein
MSADELDFSKPEELQARDGEAVRIYATDGWGGCPIQGAIFRDGGWMLCKWTHEGRYLQRGECGSDLVRKPRRVTGWLNVYGRKQLRPHFGDLLHESQHDAGLVAAEDCVGQIYVDTDGDSQAYVRMWVIMDRREFVGFVGGVLGSVGLPSAPIPAVESSLSKLRRLVEARGGSVYATSAWDTLAQGHRTLLDVHLDGKSYSATDIVGREGLLIRGSGARVGKSLASSVPCKLIQDSLEESAGTFLRYLHTVDSPKKVQKTFGICVG